MKQTLLVLALFPLIAFGGKEEREYWKKEVTPAVEKAAETYKSACGCALKATVDEKTIKSKDDMYLAKRVMESVTEGAPKHCTDDDSRKAICQMKSLEVKRDVKTAFTISGSKGVSVTDGQSYADFGMMTQELDK